VRLWAEVRQAPELAASFSLLRRYWVMAATNDGLVIALLAWSVVMRMCIFGAGGAQPIDPTLGLIAILVLLVSIIGFWREASSYVEYQMEELAPHRRRL